jgi:ABC-2 type transport system ATP-binding protein
MQPAIATRGLSKRFGRRVAVDSLSFEVPTGSICGFLGRNGAGKSTALRMMMNLTEPTSGSATLLGLDSRRCHDALMARVGFVSEAPVLYEWMKVKEAVWFTAGFYKAWHHDRVESLLSRFAIDREQKVRHLSRGTYAQLALVLALGGDPELLILDEPATGLDVLVRRNFLESIIQLIQQDGRTVLFSSHLVHEVERVADQVVVIDQGRLLLSERIDDLKERVRRVVMRPGHPEQIAALPGVLRVSRDGRDTVLTVNGADWNTRPAVDSAAVLEVTELSLEDIFIDLVAAATEDPR